MLLLALDVETTGLNYQNDSIIEIGAVLWHWETQTPLQIFSELIKEPYINLPLTNEIENLTGITTEQLTSYGQAFQGKLQQRLTKLIHHASFLVAHNASFDRNFLTQLYLKNNLTFPSKEWICTLKDVTYPASFKSKKLVNLAKEHGIETPFAHRAIFDVLTMLQVLKHYDIKEIVRSFSFPLVTVKADVSYENKDQAKEQGFHWNKETKSWQKEIRQNKLEQEKEKYPFHITIL